MPLCEHYLVRLDHGFPFSPRDDLLDPLQKFFFLRPNMRKFIAQANRHKVFIANALALGFLCLNIHHVLDALGLAKLSPDAGLGRGLGLPIRTGGAAFQSSTHGGAIEVVPQSPGGNWFGAVGREIRQPAPALFDGDATL